jgi:surface polysaccharide O-acyltransferase-like enzyme
MLIFGLVLILFAIWMSMSAQTVVLKTIGAIKAGIVGIYIILRYKKDTGP